MLKFHGLIRLEKLLFRKMLNEVVSEEQFAEIIIVPSGDY